MKVPSEHEEAKQVAIYLNALVQYKQIICYTKTAQETFTNSWGTKMKQKSEGVQKGLPDYFILTQNKLIVIELKKQRAIGKKGQLLKSNYTATPEQLLWLDNLPKISQNIVTKECYGAEEAIDFIKNNLK